MRKRLGGFTALVFVLLVFTGTMVLAQDDIAKHGSCPYCGMDRAKFAHSRMYLEYDDGSTVGTCSIHCAAIDMTLNIDKSPRAIMVGDCNSGKLIDAEKAYWVIGGDKMGVMTARAKWAFEKEADADAFVKAHGGMRAMFDDAIKASYEDMYSDVKMIRNRRAMKRMKMQEQKGGSK